MNRALRRHHRERLMKNRSIYWGNREKDQKELSRLARTATPCSCYMCRNRRQDEGPTIQECRHDQEEFE